MAGFQFNLEAVLRYKESRVELLQLEMAELQHLAAQAREVRDYLVSERVQTENRLGKLVSYGDLDINTVLQSKDYMRRLTIELGKQEIIVVEAEEKVDKKREELLKMEQEREVLDTLKKRNWQRYLNEMNRAEAQVIDESAIAGFYRRAQSDEV